METNKPSHRKLKSDIMYKFFNEPVDALDLRLTKAEAALSLADPWEEKEAKECDDSVGGDEDEEGPLDFSDVQAPHSPTDRPSSDISDEYWDEHENNNNDEDSGDKYPDMSSDVQFITARSLRSFRNHPYSRSQSLFPTRLNPPPEHLSRLSSPLVNCSSERTQVTTKIRLAQISNQSSSSGSIFSIRICSSRERL